MTANKLFLAGAVVLAIAIAIAFGFTDRDSQFIAREARPTETDSRADRSEPRADSNPFDWSRESELTSLEAIRSRRLRSEFQPIERELLANGSLSYQSLKGAMNDERSFNAVLDALHDQYYTDREATEITRIYGREIIQGFRDSEKDVSLTRLACGISVCGAAMRGNHLGEIEFTEMLMESGNDAGIYSSVILVVPPAVETAQATYRVFFSTDPRTNEIRVRP